MSVQSQTHCFEEITMLVPGLFAEAFAPAEVTYRHERMLADAGPLHHHRPFTGWLRVRRGGARRVGRPAAAR